MCVTQLHMIALCLICIAEILFESYSPDIDKPSGRFPITTVQENTRGLPVCFPLPRCATVRNNHSFPLPRLFLILIPSPSCSREYAWSDRTGCKWCLGTGHRNKVCLMSRLFYPRLQDLRAHFTKLRMSWRLLCFRLFVSSPRFSLQRDPDPTLSSLGI